MRIMLSRFGNSCAPSRIDSRYARRYGTEDSRLVYVRRRCFMPDPRGNTQRSHGARIHAPSIRAIIRSSRVAHCLGVMRDHGRTSRMAIEKRTGNRAISRMTELDFALRQISISRQPIRHTHIAGFAFVPQKPALVFFSQSCFAHDREHVRR